MTAPNLANVGSVVANNSLISLTTTSATQIITNPAGVSGVPGPLAKTFLIDTLMVANVTGTDATVTVRLHQSADNSGTGYELFSNLVVPLNSIVILADKQGGLNLLENQSIYATAGTANALKVNASWKELALAMPGAPTSLTATPGSGSASLAWTAPAVTGGYAITDYSIQYSSDSGTTWNSYSKSASTATTAIVTGLTSGTTYKYRVAAVTTVGTGPYSTPTGGLLFSSFTPVAVLLTGPRKTDADGFELPMTQQNSYTVPTGASTMKAWAVGAGLWSAGGTAYKTWSVSAGSTVYYFTENSGRNVGSKVYYNSTTIVGAVATYRGGGGGYSGGDGGAVGGTYLSAQGFRGGAVGGNGTVASCGRVTMTDVSGLKAALSLAGIKTTEDCGSSAAFGSGGGGKNDPVNATFGYGGGCGLVGGSFRNNWYGGDGAVILYFT